MACSHCTPELRPTGPRRGEHHFGVRFRDWAICAYKDGVLIKDSYEVDCLAGKAWRYVMPVRLCHECPWQGAEAYLDTGTFSVATTSDGRPSGCP